jgi:hypothetical protein
MRIWRSYERRALARTLLLLSGLFVYVLRRVLLLCRCAIRVAPSVAIQAMHALIDYKAGRPWRQYLQRFQKLDDLVLLGGRQGLKGEARSFGFSVVT